jgi:hypothetical protein
MKDFNTNTDNNDEWLTPPEIIKALGPFDLDPCAPINRPWDTAEKHYTIEDDGLHKIWTGRVWLNPPYGDKTLLWLDKLASHGSGIALIFARTETKGYHEVVFDQADSIFFFRGRIKFHYVDGRQGEAANAPSCLISYTKHDTEKIIEAEFMEKIRGKLLRNDKTIKLF